MTSIQFILPFTVALGIGWYLPNPNPFQPNEINHDLLPSEKWEAMQTSRAGDSHGHFSIVDLDVETLEIEEKQGQSDRLRVAIDLGNFSKENLNYVVGIQIENEYRDEVEDFNLGKAKSLRANSGVRNIANIPDGLKDGYYRANITVLTRGPKKGELTHLGRYYFRILEGQPEPSTALEWHNDSESTLARTLGDDVPITHHGNPDSEKDED